MLICWCSESMIFVQSLEDVRDLRAIVVKVFIRYKEKGTDLNATECQSSPDFVVVAVKERAK